MNVLQHMARLRETPESGYGSTADEDAPPRGPGWVGQGPLHDGGFFTVLESTVTAKHWRPQEDGLSSFEGTPKIACGRESQK